MLKRISNMMEDDGIRLQMEAELKREISDKEWMAEVEQWAEEIKDRMQMCSCSLEEAYKDITQQKGYFKEVMSYGKHKKITHFNGLHICR